MTSTRFLLVARKEGYHGVHRTALRKIISGEILYRKGTFRINSVPGKLIIVRKEGFIDILFMDVLWGFAPATVASPSEDISGKCSSHITIVRS
jgi:hypothetical protein